MRTIAAASAATIGNISNCPTKGDRLSSAIVPRIESSAGGATQAKAAGLRNASKYAARSQPNADHPNGNGSIPFAQYSA
jgi:hypothetical protein